MNKTFISADFHFSHSNIILGTSLWQDKSGCRPFQTVEEHDQTILDNINSVVAENDALWILGDFSVGSRSSGLSKEEAYIKYRNLIRCKDIKYIVGNHSLNKKRLRELGIFTEVHDYYELIYKKRLFCMSHYPFAEWNNASHGSIMCHGHSHGNYFGRGRIIDVGVDTNSFKPYLIDDIIELMRDVGINKIGHH